MSLESNLAEINNKIKAACAKNGRDSEEVKIIAVTKYVDTDQTEKVLDLGLVHIGENRVDVALPKYEQLKDRGVWHFIGSLQTRKIKQVIGKFDYIHSLDRLSMAEEIDKQAKKANIKVKCFIQVNVSGEETKSGLDLNDLLDFVREIAKYDSIIIVGLMTMAPNYDDKEQTRPIFKELKGLLTKINDAQILHYQITELSMGMSNDYEIAIEEGATFIRLGTVLWK